MLVADHLKSVSERTTDHLKSVSGRPTMWISVVIVSAMKLAINYHINIHHYVRIHPAMTTKSAMEMTVYSNFFFKYSVILPKV